MEETWGVLIRDFGDGLDVWGVLQRRAQDGAAWTGRLRRWWLREGARRLVGNACQEESHVGGRQRGRGQGRRLWSQLPLPHFPHHL